MNPSMKFDAISDESWHSKRNLVPGEDPIVTKTQCFDDLLIPPDHPGRQPSDTYYIDDKTLLRTHTSAHQSEHLRQGYEAFLCTGDVYRRDAVDSCHYPCFHQMDGVRVYEWKALGVASHEEAVPIVMEDLKGTLAGMVKSIFGDVEMKWVESTFPFTDPSLELEILFQGKWLEVLGCGVMRSMRSLTSFSRHSRRVVICCGAAASGSPTSLASSAAIRSCSSRAGR